jgi:hypothetical protein
MTPSEQPAELVDLSPISLAFNLHFAMPKPYIFASKTELIEMLRGKATCAAAQQCFSDESANLADVVRTGVSGNTFRAFRNLPVRPSVAFREWATNYTQNTLG